MWRTFSNKGACATMSVHTIISSMRIAIGLALCLAAVVDAQQSASVWDGVYTAEQADRGKALYGKQCASCHGAALDGSGQAPPLAGADFKGDWNGQTTDDLFEKMQTSMPADRPGQLSREQNADVLAFLLSSNGFPAGQKELPTDAAALQKIRFESAKPK
jgi:S-disulfanyl-L-cysteine oxidoreductase SoxD